MKLLLWDIDGTLICNGAAGERALIRVMKEIHKIETTLEPFDYRGRTDRRIAQMMLEYFKLPHDEKSVHDFIEHYLIKLHEELPKIKGSVHPGIVDILDQVKARTDLAQGLLTGNMIRGAELKLSHFDVWSYFEFGAFSDDSMNRNDLGPHAVKRANEKFAFTFPPQNVFVIGDTPHDIECGKVIGAKTIAVATGAFTVEELKKHNPTATFQDFSDPDSFFKVIDL
jgi:phosphoglycolate phosphatase